MAATSTIEFIEKASVIHGDLYDYDKFIYKNNHSKGIIICKLHNEFLQRPNNHLSGQGCPECKKIKIGNFCRKSLGDFIIEARHVHGNLYDYDRFVYVNNKTKGIIICKIHGEFMQIVKDHLNGCGCPKCSNVGIPTTEEFIKKARKIHGDKYGYSVSNYIGAHRLIEMVCPIHKEFKQTPNAHLKGAGCSKCTSRVSKPETKWLDSLNVPLRQHTIQTKTRKINVDGYDPETNTVYQFHGDYWHGNPDVFDLGSYNKIAKRYFRELYETTLHKDKLIQNAGYNLVIMWENDFNNNIRNLK